MNTNKRGWQPWAVGAAVALVAAGAGVWWVVRSDHVVVVSRQQLQEQLDAAFPIEKSYGGVATLTLAHPRVALRPGTDRVDFSVDATVSALGGAWRAGAAGHLSGQVRFVPPTRALYLDDPRVDRLDIPTLPPAFAGPVRDAAEMAAREYFADHPLYQERAPLFAWGSAQMVVKGVVVKDGALVITLGRRP